MLNELLRRCCPKLLSTFAAMDYNLTDLTATWFSHLFCGTLPAETAVRVWDCVFCEGPKVLFRVALALLKVTSGYAFCGVWYCVMVHILMRKM